MAVITGTGYYVTSGKLAYHNLLEDSTGTVTASTEATGYPKENAYDWRVFDTWQPTTTGDSWIQVAFSSSKTVNYFGVAGHDLTTQGATIKLQYSTNSGSTWNDATTATSGFSDRVIFEIFDDIAASYWRILVNAPTTVASIGIVSFGVRLDLPRGFPAGFTPASLARKNEYQTSMSEDGQYIGRSVSRKVYDGRFTIPLLEPSWVRLYWESFIDHAELKPFFFSWDTSSYVNESVIGWMKDRYTPPSYDTTITMRIQLEFSARR